MGTKSALSAGVVVVVALLMGAAATGGYVVGSRRPDNVRATEPVTRVATTKPEIILPSAPVMPSPEPPAKTESAKIGRRPESSEKDPAPPGRPVIDPRKVRYGRMPKPLPEDVLNAESWPEFYQRAKERRVNSELLEDLIFQRLSKELRLDSKTTQALHRLFEAEREAVTQAIVDAGGGPNSFEKKSDELGMNWNAVYADWNRQRDIVRQTHENEYLKHLTYDQLVFFNSHLRNSTIQLETCYANDEVYYLVSGVGIPVK